MKKLIFLFLSLACLTANAQTKKALFIGNSYTAYNHLAELTQELATSAGDNLIVGSSAISSYTWQLHTQDATTMGLIRQGGWDFVSLQEFSTNPSEPLAWVEQNVYPYAQYLDGEINTYNPGAETIFYMTWGRRDGDAGRCPVNPPVCTYIGMDDLTRDRYMYMAQANHAIVSPVGAVWRYIRANYPSIELYIADGSHPTPAGSYAAACTFYTTIFRKSPLLITDNYSLSASDAANIRNAAKLVVYDSLLTWHIGEYDTDSQAPSVPTGLAQSNMSPVSFTLSWTASTDNIAVTGYDIYQNGIFSKTVTSTSTSITGLTPSTSYAYTIRAKDAAGNISAASSPLNITTSAPYSLTITGVTASNKVYNANVNATLITSGASLSGVQNGDNVVLSTGGASGTFANKNAGTGKTVTTTGFSISGTDAIKYSLTQPSLSANITQATLTINGVTASNKVYDGNTSALVNTGSAALSGVIGTDAVTLLASGVSASFNNKNAGASKPVATTGFVITGTDAGNYSVNQPVVSANITKSNLTATGVTANDKVYNGNNTAALNTSGGALSGVIGSDVVNLVSTGASGSFASKNVGLGKTVTTSGFTLGGADSGNYNITQPTLTASITASALNINGVTANNKVYDGNTSATLNTGSASLATIFGSDVVTLNSAGATGTFTDANVGNGKTVNTSGFTISGTDAGNYSLVQPVTTANITGVTLTITGVTAANKVYDGNSVAVLNTSGASLSGVIGGDNVVLNTAGATGSFATKIVGNGKTVTTLGFTLGGTDAGKYIITQPSTTANITKANLTISGVTANNKVYDGTTAATIVTVSASLNSIIGSDAVTLVTSGATGTFATSNIGTGISVSTSGFTLSGADSGNYSVTQPVTTANITAFGLTITGVTANNKVYDGTVATSLNTGSAVLNGVIGSDNVVLVKTGAIGSFVNKNAGNGKTVNTSGFTLSGTDASKYSVTQPTTTGNITKADLTVTGITGVNRVYNRTTAAALNTSSAVLLGVFSGDVVTIVTGTATGTFATKNSGTAKTVTVAGLSLSGADAGNYNLIQPVTQADITNAPLTIASVTAVSKIYDKTVTAALNTGSASLSGIFSGDVVTLNSAGATGTFVSAVAGNGIQVNCTGFSITGTDAANYSVTQPVLSANISPVQLSVTGVTATGRTYNGTTAVSLNTSAAALSGILSGDNVILVTTGATGTFATKTAGSNKTVTTSGFTLAGSDASNYVIVQPSATATITAANLTVTGVTVNTRTYNRAVAASVNTSSASLNGIFSGDVVSLNTSAVSANYGDKNVGTGKPVTISGLSLSGTDAANYTLTQPSASGDIALANLTVTGVAAVNRLYNGNSVASLNTSAAVLSGVFSGDAVTLVTSGATGAFPSKNVGSNLVVTVAGLTINGADASNYQLTQPQTTGSISSLPLTITGILAGNKVYNANTSATLNVTAAVLNGLISGDIVSLNSASAIGSFSNKNVGSNKTVTITGLTLSGTDAGNYSLTQPAATASIVAASLTITGVSITQKVYNATLVAQLNTSAATLVGAFAGDNVTLSVSGASAVYSDKNAGTGKAVTTSGFTLSGTDATNYTVLQPVLAGNITRATVTIAGVSANNKIYDGSTLTTLNTAAAALSGVMGGDIVTLVSTSATANFSSATAGNLKSVTTAGFTLSGTDGGNYTVTQPVLSANITPRVLTIGGSFTANNKAYDGNTTASLTSNSLTLLTKAGTDDVSLVPVAVFANRNVGTGITVSLTGSTLTGADIANYTLSLTGAPTTTASITLYGLTVTGITANNKVYDGTTKAVINTTGATLMNIIGSDIVTLVTASATGSFTTKNAGIGKTVIVNGLTLTGPDAGKYSLIQPTTTASITSAPLIITGVAGIDRQYNGVVAISLNTQNASLSGVALNDIVNLNTSSATGSLADRYPGTSKTVTTSGFSINGADASNYNLTQPQTTANILPAVLTITGISANNKIYNGNTDAVLNVSVAALSGIIGSDNVQLRSVGVTGTFTDKNAATGKTVNVSGFSLTGSSSAYYSIVQPVLAADITPKSVVITANSITKNYGESLVFTGKEISVSGLISGDTINNVLLSSAGASANAATGSYDILVAGGLNPNYSLSYARGTLNVNKSPLTVSADNKNRKYGSDNPGLTISFTGFRNGEGTSALRSLPTITTTATKRSHPGKYAISLSGGSSDNYDLHLVDGNLDVEYATLTVTATSKTKIYGQENPVLTMRYSGFVDGDDSSNLDILPVIRTAANQKTDAGIYDITVSGGGDKDYAFDYINGTMTILKADQTINFPDLNVKLRMTQEMDLNAIASSGLPVEYLTSDESVARMENNKLIADQDGPVTITAIQPGNKNYNEAEQVSQSMTILPTFDGISSLFTPNGDGMNDYWRIPDIQEYGKVHVTVYNRFGQTVFEADNYKNDWDGTWKGYPLPSASYYFILISSEKGIVKGVVNIVR